MVHMIVQPLPDDHETDVPNHFLNIFDICKPHQSMSKAMAEGATMRGLIRAYVTAAARAGQYHAQPEVDWLDRHMADASARGEHFVELYGRAIALHLAACARGARALAVKQSREVLTEVAA